MGYYGLALFQPPWWASTPALRPASPLHGITDSVPACCWCQLWTGSGNGCGQGIGTGLLKHALQRCVQGDADRRTGR